MLDERLPKACYRVYWRETMKNGPYLYTSLDAYLNWIKTGVRENDKYLLPYIVRDKCTPT